MKFRRQSLAISAVNGPCCDLQGVGVHQARSTLLISKPDASRRESVNDIED